MSRSLSVVVAGVFVLSIVSGSRADFPASGQDNMSTKGFFKFQLLDGTFVEFTLGPDPTVIGRSDPHTEGAAADTGTAIDNTGFTMPGSGTAPDPALLPEDWPESDPARREVHTEILDLALSNGSYTLRVGQTFWDSVSAAGRTDLYGNSFGEVASQYLGIPQDWALDFPAQGVFNVCAEFEHPVVGRMYNRTPMIIRKTELLAFPPDISNAATTYMHDPSFIGATFFDPDGIPIGKLLSAGHGADCVPEGTPDALPPMSCPVSFTVDSTSIGLANILPNQVNIDSTGIDPRLDVTVYVSRSGAGPVGGRPGLPDGSNALSGSFTGVATGAFPDFVLADAITSFSYGRDGTIPQGGGCGNSSRGNLYFSVDRNSPPRQGVCFGAASVGANVFVAVSPPFGSYSDVVQPAAIPGTNLLVVDSNELGLAPGFGDPDDDEVTGLELKDEIQVPDPLLWFGTLDGPANAALGRDTATIYVYDPAAAVFEPGNFATYAVPGDVGLVPGDEIDALVLSDTDPGVQCPPRPDGVLQANSDEALFSLKRGSPSLGGDSPADIFYTVFDGTFSLFIPAAAMGLDPILDDIDAADVKPNPMFIPTVSEWGLIVMALLVLTAGTVMYGRRRRIGGIANSE